MAFPAAPFKALMKDLCKFGEMSFPANMIGQ
jgi:hypothetical protein